MRVIFNAEAERPIILIRADMPPSILFSLKFPAGSSFSLMRIRPCTTSFSDSPNSARLITGPSVGRLISSS